MINIHANFYKDSLKGLSSIGKKVFCILWTSFYAKYTFIEYYKLHNPFIKMRVD